MWIYLLVGCKVWENIRHGAGKGHGAGKKAWRWKKRAWRWEKGAWRGAILKGAGGNTIIIPFRGFPRTRNFSGWTSVRSKTLLKCRYEQVVK